MILVRCMSLGIRSWPHSPRCVRLCLCLLAILQVSATDAGREAHVNACLDSVAPVMVQIGSPRVSQPGAEPTAGLQPQHHSRMHLQQQQRAESINLLLDEGGAQAASRGHQTPGPGLKPGPGPSSHDPAHAHAHHGWESYDLDDEDDVMCLTQMGALPPPLPPPQRPAQQQGLVGAASLCRRTGEAAVPFAVAGVDLAQNHNQRHDDGGGDGDGAADPWGPDEEDDAMLLGQQAVEQEEDVAQVDGNADQAQSGGQHAKTTDQEQQRDPDEGVCPCWDEEVEEGQRDGPYQHQHEEEEELGDAYAEEQAEPDLGHVSHVGHVGHGPGVCGPDDAVEEEVDLPLHTRGIIHAAAAPAARDPSWRAAGLDMEQQPHGTGGGYDDDDVIMLDQDEEEDVNGEGQLQQHCGGGCSVTTGNGAAHAHKLCPLVEMW